MLHPERTSNGYRTYGSEAVRIVENIRLLLPPGSPRRTCCSSTAVCATSW
ncbi:hypothetical protein [Streptomyces murinus]